MITDNLIYSFEFTNHTQYDDNQIQRRKREINKRVAEVINRTRYIAMDRSIENHILRVRPILLTIFSDRVVKLAIQMYPVFAKHVYEKLKMSHVYERRKPHCGLLASIIYSASLYRNGFYMPILRKILACRAINAIFSPTYSHFFFDVVRSDLEAIYKNVLSSLVSFYAKVLRYVYNNIDITVGYILRSALEKGPNDLKDAGVREDEYILDLFRESKYEIDTALEIFSDIVSSVVFSKRKKQMY